MCESCAFTAIWAWLHTHLQDHSIVRTSFKFVCRSYFCLFPCVLLVNLSLMPVYQAGIFLIFKSVIYWLSIGQHAYIGFLAWLEHFLQVWSHQDPSVSPHGATGWTNKQTKPHFGSTNHYLSFIHDMLCISLLTFTHAWHVK